MRKYHKHTKTGTCLGCGKVFSYLYNCGAPKKHCSGECRVKYQIRMQKENLPFLPKCSNPACSNKATQIGSGICNTCYYRIQRTGNYIKPKPKYRYKTGASYIKLLSPEHELADSNGNVFEHRKVAYEKYGSGIQGCFWCGESLKWEKVVIDHLNENKQDNRPGNLVISCNKCNRIRGALLSLLTRIKPESFGVFISQMVKYRNKYGKKTFSLSKEVG